MLNFLMVKLRKNNFGMVYALISCLLWLPFFHYHPETVHTHSDELTPHHHGGHFHSQEIHSLANLIDRGPTQLPHGEDHSHSETSKDTNYFNVSLQKSDITPEKTQKTLKVKKIRNLFSIAGSYLSHSMVSYRVTLSTIDPAFSAPERSPPFRFI